jgi:HK97 family phage major capsid protein
LRGADGHPVLSNNYNQADGRVPTIMGYPVVINQHMSSAMTAGLKVLLFGDFSSYLVRDVAGDGGLTIIRQSETYATSGQIGWVAIHRSGGLLLAANATGQNPIKHMKMAAS